jgi:two-component system OmpR family sensor kinase
MSAPTRSLSTLLTRRLALIALGLALVNLTAVALRYASLPDELARSALQRQLDRAAEDVQHSPGPSQLSAKLRADFQTHPQDYAFAVVDARGEQIEAMNPELLPADLQWLHRSESVDATVELDGRSLRISARAIDHPRGAVRVIVVMAGDPAHWKLRALLDELATHVALPLVPVVLLLIGANAALVRRAMQPVTAAAAWARGLRPGAHNPAPPSHAAQPDEIRDLVDALARALQRLEGALSAERQRSAEAAHALRTPLAVLTARLDALPPGPTEDALRRDVRQLRRSVQQLLSVATAEAAAPGDELIDLADVAHAVVVALAPFAHAQGAALELQVHAESAQVRADPASVELALTNLVENAVLHGGGTVLVTVGPGPQLRVSDEGRGLPAGQEAAIFEPFRRGPDAAAGGAGLGLAIVRRAMASQEGAVSACNRAQGGAEFRLTFKPAAR